jgi:hypothetical protein
VSREMMGVCLVGLEKKNKKMNFDQDKKKLLIIQNTLDILKTYAKSEWKLQKNCEHINLYTTFNNVVKIEAILTCSSTYLYHLCSDVYEGTRYKWDENKVPIFGIGVIHNLSVENVDENLNYLEYTINPQKLLMDYRYFEGIQYTKNNSAIIFRSCVSKEPPSDINCIKSKIIMGCWIKSIGDNKVFITQIIRADFGYWLNMDHNLLIQRIHMLEKLAQNIPRMQSIYNPYTCSMCKKLVNSQLLECNYCKQERYGRCPYLHCYRPLMENEKKCIKCGEEKKK